MYGGTYEISQFYLLINDKLIIFPLDKTILGDGNVINYLAIVFLEDMRRGTYEACGLVAKIRK